MKQPIGGEYQSVERVLRLLSLLMKEQEGVTREEIYHHIPAYQSAPSERAQRRMVERDMRQLEQVGFHVERQRKGKEPAIYKVIMETPGVA